MRMYDTPAMEWAPVAFNSRTGEIVRKYIEEGELLPGIGFGCDFYRYVAGDNPYDAPRHRHDFEQIRICLDGRMDFARGRTMHRGGVSYFPAGAFYGPTHINGATIMLVQWSEHWVTRQQHDDAVVELRKHGTFTGGNYEHHVNGKLHRIDSLNAIWEHVFQRPSSFPTPRYHEPIFINPDGFEMVRVNDIVSYKMLGRFTERDLFIHRIRWEKDGTIELPDGRSHCALVMTGEVDVDGVPYGEGALGWSAHADHDRIAGLAGTEVTLIGFPRLDPAVVTDFTTLASAGSQP